MSQSIDLQAVLADLESRRDAFNRAIDKAIHGIREIIALTASQEPAQAVLISDPVRDAIVKAAANTLKDKSLADASIAILARAGHGMTNQEIAAALDQAGFVHGSSNFPNLVGTALWRTMQRRKVVRVGRHWLLPEWPQRVPHGEEAK